MAVIPGTLNTAARIVGGTAHGLGSATDGVLRTVLNTADAVLGGQGLERSPGFAGQGAGPLERLTEGALHRNLANDGPGRGPPFVPPGHAGGEASGHGGRGPDHAPGLASQGGVLDRLTEGVLNRGPANALLGGVGHTVRTATDTLGSAVPRNLVDTRLVAGTVVSLAQQAPSTVAGVVGTLQRELSPTDFRHFVQDAAGAVRAQVRTVSDALAGVRAEVVNLGQRAETLPGMVHLIARDVASTPWTNAIVRGVPTLSSSIRDAGGWLPTVVVPHLSNAGKLERIESWTGVLDRLTTHLASAPGLRPLLAPALQQLLTVLRGVLLESLPGPLRVALVRLMNATEAALGMRPGVPAGSEALRPGAPLTTAAEALKLESAPAALALASTAAGDAPAVLTDGAPAYIQLSGIEAMPFGAPADTGGQSAGPPTPLVDAQGFPVFNPLAEVYLEHSHIESASTDQRFAAANAELGQALRDSPSLQDHLGLTDAQAGFLERQPEPWSEAARIAPPDLVWHHHQDPGRLQLVLRSDHQAANPSLGGASVWGGLR